jgi:hypothetical protein
MIRCVAQVCHPSYLRSTNRKVTVLGSMGIRPDPMSKITNAKKAGKVVQMVKCQSSKARVHTYMHTYIIK